MSDPVYLLKGRTTGDTVKPEGSRPGKDLEVIVERPQTKVATTESRRATGKRASRRKRRFVKPVRVIRIIRSESVKENERPYFAGDGDLLVKAYAGEMTDNSDDLEMQQIAYASVLNVNDTGVSISSYNLRLETSIKLTEDGYPRASDYLMENVDLRRSWKKKNGIVIEDYKGHGFFLKGRELVIIIQTPMVFELDELVLCEREMEDGQIKGSLKPADGKRKSEIYNALLDAYSLLEPVFMDDAPT